MAHAIDSWRYYVYNKGMTSNTTPKETTMNKVNSVYSTRNGGYSAHIYKVAIGYKVDITRNKKTYVYYCKNEGDCYNAITKLSRCTTLPTSGCFLTK